MTRSELIERVSRKQHRLPEKTTEAIVKAVFEQLTDAILDGQRIEIRGFGSFSLRQHPARVVRNPKTGKTFHTAGKSTVHFKPGKDMRERVNQMFGQPLEQA